MIEIIFGNIRKGKTLYLTYLLNEACFDPERNANMKEAVQTKADNGFNVTLPSCCVAANYPTNFFKFGYSRRSGLLINPFKLGFFNQSVSTHFIAPYTLIGIDEAQKYFNSRMSRLYPDWQSRYFEWSGHNHLDFKLVTQRPDLIDINVRQLCKFTEILDINIKYNKYDEIKQIAVYIREIESCEAYELYRSSGKKDKSLYQDRKVVIDYNVFDCYNSFGLEPKFYLGHFKENYYNVASKFCGESMKEYIEYIKALDDELPKNFYKRD